MERLEEESFKMKNVSAALAGALPGIALLSHSHPPPLPVLSGPCLGVHKALCDFVSDLGAQQPG